MDDVDKEQKLALADASRPTVSAGEHRAAEKEGKDTRLLSACHSSSLNTHSLSRQSHLSIYHLLQLSAGYLRGSP